MKGAGNAEINRLYKEAVAGKKKQDKEREMNRQASDTEKRSAYYQCKHFIKKRLNDPSSLDFPDSDTALITNKGDPAAATGSEEEVNTAFDEAFNMLKARIESELL